MISQIKTISLSGLDGQLVEVQTFITNGLPNFDIVGLPDMSVKESKERIRAAIKNSNIEFPTRKILINLSPANTRKEGTSYDLPIAVGILLSLNMIKNENLQNTIFIGELSLDGKINHIDGVLPMCIEALKLGIKRVILPKSNEIEAAFIDELEIVGVHKLEELISYLNGNIEIERTQIDILENLNRMQKTKLDFADIKGQENVKRALEIAAAGSHNCLLTGSPRKWKNYGNKKIAKHIARYDF